MSHRIVLPYGVCFLLLVGAATALGSEPEVVAYEESPAQSISDKALKKMYTGRSRVWANGSRVIVTALRDSKNPVHRKFLKNYLHIYLWSVSAERSKRYNIYI